MAVERLSCKIHGMCTNDKIHRFFFFFFFFFFSDDIFNLKLMKMVEMGGGGDIDGVCDGSHQQFYILQL